MSSLSLFRCSLLRLRPHALFRTFTTTPSTDTNANSSSSSVSSHLSPTPSPPRLPKAEQEEFERLQKAATGAFSNPTSPSAFPKPQEGEDPESELLHPHIRRGATPEFEGDVNPQTGEIGGPKNDPLKYGDWSFNGRVTDF